MVKAPAGSSEIDQEHGPAAESIHFPAIPCIRNNPSFNDSSNHGFYPYTGANALDCYVRHPGKEAIVKALLRELQMPDAAYVELENMGKVFICGRCNHNRPTEWDALVEHYHLRRRDWVGNTFIPNSYQTRHPVIFRNLHDLGSDTNPKPLVRIASSEGNNGTPVRSYDVVAECIICRGIDFYDECSFESSARMREHMQELHGTVEPVEKLHFIDEARNLSRIFFWAGFDRRDWEQKWDRFHDTLGATGATVHQTDSRSGSTSQTTNSSQVPRIVSA
ncbi:hypothetical protein B0J17DRAFT_676952 [Rhizoctonia solani]|nr:hypothetical protein B0J17DRAFT_676952 [Rhizoctonia solani]